MHSTLNGEGATARPNTVALRGMEVEDGAWDPKILSLAPGPSTLNLDPIPLTTVSMEIFWNV